ncbi:MAG: glycerate kinase [Candidatus Limnocylindrales bacterium]
MTLRVLVAPDSYKGTLTSVQVAQALADGWLRARPGDTIDRCPMADGGAGLLDALLAADPDWQALPVASRDPLDRPIRGRFLRSGARAVVELADASGLWRVAAEERDAGAASTFGTGLTLAAAIGLGVRDVLLGVGGSATTDGGSGILAALGARLLDAGGTDLPPGGAALGRLARVDPDGLSPLLAEVRLTIASDVSNPLLGPQGAAAVYGPQKGASPQQVRELDRALAHYADVLEAACGHGIRDVPGAGAAGGAVAGLLAIADRFAAFAVRPGVEEMMGLVGFGGRLAGSSLVLTGEGRVDAQTAFGKTAHGVARQAHRAGVPCLVIGGSVEPDGLDAFAGLDAVLVPACENHRGLETAIAAGAAPLARAAERVARLVSLGALLGSRPDRG